MVSKEILIKTLEKELNINLTKEFIIGVETLYKVSLFNVYLNKVKKEGYALENSDLISMQQSHPLLSYFIREMSMVIFIANNGYDMNKTLGCNATILTNLSKMQCDAPQQFELFIYFFQSIGQTFSSQESATKQIS